MKSRTTKRTGQATRLAELGNANNILVGATEGKRPLGIYWHEGEDNIKMQVINTVCGMWAGFVSIKMRSSPRPCGHGIEPCNSFSRQGVFHQLSEYQLFKLFLHGAVEISIDRCNVTQHVSMCSWVRAEAAWRTMCNYRKLCVFWGRGFVFISMFCWDDGGGGVRRKLWIVVASSTTYVCRSLFQGAGEGGRKRERN
jgi:hypothetical protein